MECKKCLVHIPNEYEFIISQNVCPKCGNKLMLDAAMKIFIDLKKRLNEVEFVMDKATVCERVAMFIVSNYEVIPHGQKISAHEQVNNISTKFNMLKDQISSIDEDVELSAEQIRLQEAERAEEIAIAREMGMNVDGLEDGEEMVSGKVDDDRIQRLKKLANSAKSGVMVRRSDG